MKNQNWEKEFDKSEGGREIEHWIEWSIGETYWGGKTFEEKTEEEYKKASEKVKSFIRQLLEKEKANNLPLAHEIAKIKDKAREEERGRIREIIEKEPKEECRECSGGELLKDRIIEKLNQ